MCYTRAMAMRVDGSIEKEQQEQQQEEERFLLMSRCVLLSEADRNCRQKLGEDRNVECLNVYLHRSLDGKIFRECNFLHRPHWPWTYRRRVRLTSAVSRAPMTYR